MKGVPGFRRLSGGVSETSAEKDRPRIIADPRVADDQAVGGVDAGLDDKVPTPGGGRSERRPLGPDRIEDLARRGIDQLDHRIFDVERQLAEPSPGGRIVVVELGNGAGPARILSAGGIGDVHIARPAFHGDLTRLFIEAYDSKAGRAGVETVAAWLLLRVSGSVVGDFIAEPVEIITRVFGSARLPVLPWDKRFPPTKVEVGNRRHAEGPYGITVFVDAMLEKGSKVLVPSEVKSETVA